MKLSLNPYDPAQLVSKGPGIEPVVLEDGIVYRVALLLTLACGLLFFVWAARAPLDDGVVINGTVAVAGNRKAVQHPSGGVVQELPVQEGSVVQRGDVLLRINPLNNEANLSSAEGLYINLLATEARLEAERAGGDIRWKAELRAFGDGDLRVAEAKLRQMQLFGSRQSELESQQRILRQQISGQEALAQSLTKLIAEKRSQLDLVALEARNVSQLAKEGYVPEARANEVMRAQSSLQAELATLEAETLRSAAGIEGTRSQLLQQRAAFDKDIDNQLSEIQTNREAYLTRVESLKFDRQQAAVRAPVSGTVVGLKVNTVGGVIAAGQVLMEIVPDTGDLQIEAQVPPAAIDKVREGLEADLRFSAFNHNTTPVIPGRVHLVGADRITGVNGAEGDHYLAKVVVTDEGRALLSEYRIQPGMPVEVVVRTGERTFMSYLLKPLTDRFARSFKDS